MQRNVQGVVMSERPELVTTNWPRGEAMGYKCSLCGQVFLPPEDRTPKEAAAEVMAAFKEHVREQHGERHRGEEAEPLSHEATQPCGKRILNVMRRSPC